jgi:hypothetical protein
MLRTGKKRRQTGWHLRINQNSQSGTGFAGQQAGSLGCVNASAFVGYGCECRLLCHEAIMG